MTPRSVLEEVRKAVEAGLWRNRMVFHIKERWCGDLGDPGCILQLLAQHGEMDEAVHTAIDLIAAVIYIDQEVGSTIAWNDDPARTREEVLEVLDRAILSG